MQLTCRGGILRLAQGEQRPAGDGRAQVVEQAGWFYQPREDACWLLHLHQQCALIVLDALIIYFRKPNFDFNKVI